NSDDQKPDSDIREVESDENDVEKAYEGEWEPVETEQSGEHVTNYDDGSDDRKEIKQAVTEATGIDSDNIIEHWIGNNGEQKVEEWEEIEKEQSGEHVTNYDYGSDDRKEIKQAVTEATGIDSDNIIEHWIGNNGEQKVEATVSDTVNKTSYRVYLSWINEEGW